jgi:excisionase family DNA binding protein
MRKITVTEDDGTTRTYTGGLLTPAEVAAIFGVDRRTIYRWTRTGKLPSVPTLGGHNRYPADKVDAVLAESMQERRP